MIDLTILALLYDKSTKFFLVIISAPTDSASQVDMESSAPTDSPVLAVPIIMSPSIEIFDDESLSKPETPRVQACRSLNRRKLVIINH